MQTIESPFEHSEDEHGIVHLLSPNARATATDIQNQLVGVFGDSIWLQQPQSLHITLMEIINDTKYEGLSRQQYFEQWYQGYNQVTKDTIGQFEPFNVTFTELLVSQRAIILKATDSKQFNGIRAGILAVTELPQGTKLPPDITHCTLARFTKVIDLEQAINLTKDISAHLVERIGEFALVRDLGPPDFNSLPLETYALGK